MQFAFLKQIFELSEKLFCNASCRYFVLFFFNCNLSLLKKITCNIPKKAGFKTLSKVMSINRDLAIELKAANFSSQLLYSYS